MVKCAVFNCRSGYRPTKYEKTIIEAGGSAACNHSVFSFPKADRPEIRRKWIAAMKRSDTDWNPDHAGICELHFLPEDFQRETFRKTERQRKILRATAVPSVFNCYSDTAKPKQTGEQPTSLSSLSARHEATNMLLQQQSDAMFEAEKVVSIGDMWEKLSKDDRVEVTMANPFLENAVTIKEEVTVKEEEIDEKGIMSEPNPFTSATGTVHVKQEREESDIQIEVAAEKMAAAKRRYTLEERIFIIKNWFGTGKKSDEVKAKFEQAFPNTIPPSRQAMYELDKKFHETGSVMDATLEGRPKTGRNCENVIKVSKSSSKCPKCHKGVHQVN